MPGTAASDSERWRHASKVVKTLWPPRPGTVRLYGKYGSRLVCVRYRHDATNGYRYTTIELVVDQAPIRHRNAASGVEVQIHFLDREMRTKIQAVGGRWDQRKKVWRVARSAAKRLGLWAGVEQ